ncbi:T9SS type A sorting domain-containing protein [candidate division KSB1 bacterium]|nr:T9SS type A sorting domain-containing protein [candidate division KSB1 bacterium]
MFKSALYVISVVTIALMTVHSQVDVYATDYIYQQQDDEWGLVVMEAEHYTDMIMPGDEYFEFVIEPEFFSGEGGMQAVAPGAPYVTGDAALASSPALTYSIEFVKADSVFLWVRGSHEGGGDDSFHAGIDGVITATSARIGYHGEPNGVWTWLGINMDNVKPGFFIDTPGLHQLEIYVRENGIKHDKFVLTTSRDYDPELFDGEFGPDPTLLAVEKPANSATPQDFKLNQNYPNPFNSSTTISYDLEKAGHVRLDIYNVSGHIVTTLIDGFQNAGSYEFTWIAHDTQNMPLASGIYFVHLQTESQNSTKRMLLIQ